VLSRGEAETGGRDNPAIQADVCEAVIAALYLDGGLAAAARFIERHWGPLIEAAPRPPQDAKTALQEWAQSLGLPLPDYREVGREGPDHEPLFTIELRLEGRAPVRATGPSKRAAEQAAAAALLRRLGEWGEE
jgi:ribonuclease-3